MFIQSITLVVTSLIIAFHHNRDLTLVTGIGLVAIVVFYRVTIPLIAKRMKEVEHADGMSASVAVESFSSIKMVAACGAEGKMVKRYATWVEACRQKGLAMSPLAAIQHSPGNFGLSSYV